MRGSNENKKKSNPEERNKFDKQKKNSADKFVSIY